MSRNRLDESDAQIVAAELGVPVTEVRRAVAAFFDAIIREADSLHLDNECRIYSRKAFDARAFAVNIPHIGRMGPVYSRYLTWRANEAKELVQEHRGRYREKFTRDEIDTIAGEVLAGRTPPPVQKHKGNEFYKRVWLVGTEGRKLARQVIRKEKE